MRPPAIRQHPLPAWGKVREPGHAVAAAPPPGGAGVPQPTPASIKLTDPDMPSPKPPRTALEWLAWAWTAAWLYLRQNPGWAVSAGIHLLAALVIVGIHVGVIEQPPILGLEVRQAGDDEFGPLDQIGEAAPLRIAQNEQAEDHFGFSGDLLAETSNNAQADQFTAGSAGGEEEDQGNDGSAEAGFHVAFFGAQAKGQKFVYIVDMSGSMIGDRFRRAVTELTRSISKLSPDQSFYVFFFNDRTYPLLYPRNVKGLQKATKTNITRANRWISSRSPSGTTNPLFALEQALALKPDAIFLLTDGELDNPAEAREILRKKNKSNTTLHTIAFESEEGARTLEALAKENNGTFRFVK